jgi:chemotaxis signal transduction protein
MFRSRRMGLVSGLMNLRGQIVTAVDLRQRLELPQRTQDALPMSVVVRAPDGAVSMLVDDIGKWSTWKRKASSACRKRSTARFVR